MSSASDNLSIAMEGNRNGVKLKDCDVRQEAFRQYCAHIAKGKAKGSFFFIHPEFSCTYKTLDKYIKDNPTEFPPIQVELAKSLGYNRWEQVVEDSAEGRNQEANTASLQMLMRNKFGWDKKDPVVENAGATEIVQIIVHGIENTQIDFQPSANKELSTSDEET